MQWILLPYICGYLEAGEFTRKGKVWYAIKVNLWWQILGILTLTGLSVFLFYTEKGASTLQRSRGFEGLLAGLSIALGLV